MLSFLKKFFSLFPHPIFHSKTHRGTFFVKDGGNSLKRMHVAGGHIKSNKDEQGKGVKNWKFQANILSQCP